MNVRVTVYGIIARQTIDSSTLAAAKQLGSTPFQSLMITQSFKVVNATHILIVPGQTLVIESSFHLINFFTVKSTSITLAI